MKKKIKNIGMLLVCLALLSPNLTAQEITISEAAAIVNSGINVYKAIDSNCDGLQSAGSLKVYRNNACGEGDCIPFKKRCNGGVNCK